MPELWKHGADVQRTKPLRRHVSGRRTLAQVVTIGVFATFAAFAFAQAPAITTTPSAQATEAYVLQRGDELSIKVFGHPEVDDTVTIRPDGRISAPLVDEIEAAGLSTVALDATLTARLAKFFREPQVSVIVRRVANLKVFVGGEVGQPGVVAISGELTALGAVYEAGGFRPSARTDSVMLLRESKGAAPIALRLDLKRLEANQAMTMLQPHDVIFVPMSRIAKVDRFVDQYARQLLPISLTAGFSYVMGPTFIK